MLLARLSLHYPRPDLEAAQYRLIFEDMANDLCAWPAYLVEKGIAGWRQSDKSQFFPRSGEIIEQIRAIAKSKDWREQAPRYLALPDIERKWPFQLKPWRQVMLDNGRDPATMPEKQAQALDAMQIPPDWAQA